MADFSKRPAVVSAVVYQNPMAAFHWLQTAFGLEPAMLITDAEGKLAHSEMSFGDGYVMIGSEWSEDHKSPASLSGKNTQTVHLQMEDDIDAHCERARAAGAEILDEPSNQFYGDRSYRAKDLEGHIWTFAQTVETVSQETWEKELGLTMKTWP